MKFTTTVDPHIQDIPRIKLKIDPGAAVRDDAGGIQQLTAGVRLALVVIEEDPRGAVQLADNHPFSAVHHERPVSGHQRDLAKVNLLLLNVLDRAGSGALVDIPQDQLDSHLEWSRIGHAPLMAFLDTVLGLAKSVADKLERSCLIEILDRKDRAEDPLQSGVRPMFRRKDTLQELVVRVPLDLQQVGNVDELANPTERASDAEVICQLQSHYCCSPNSRYLSSTAPPASSSFFFIASASAFAIPSLTGLGALSTRSLASFKPRLVSSRTTLMT